MLGTGFSKKSVQNVRNRIQYKKKICLKNVQRPRHSRIHVIHLTGKDVEGRKEYMVAVYHR
jgi:hypothetical protein